MRLKIRNCRFLSTRQILARLWKPVAPFVDDEISRRTLFCDTALTRTHSYALIRACRKGTRFPVTQSSPMTLCLSYLSRKAAIRGLCIYTRYILHACQRRDVGGVKGRRNSKVAVGNVYIYVDIKHGWLSSARLADYRSWYKYPEFFSIFRISWNYFQRNWQIADTCMRGFNIQMILNA